MAALQTNTTGSNNTAIGAFADVSGPGLTNATAIGANATVSQSNSLILGNNANVGIGTTAPSASLQVENSAVSGSTAIFYTNSASNPGPTVSINNNGSGLAADFRSYTSSGGVLNTQITSASNPANVISALTSGTGYAGYFQINNANNTLNALFATTNGPGAAINATNTYNGASALRDGIRVSVTGAGGSTNTAGYFSASGSTINNALHLDYGHLKATGPAPIITGGTLSGTSLAGGSTDIKGTINSTGAVPNNSSATVIIDFNRPYASVPVVVASPAGNGANVYRLTCAVTAVSTTSFTITLYNNNTGGGIPSPSINYIVIE